MNRQNPTRISPPAGEKLSTKIVLIEVAESLFGRHGFDGISLREIAAAAGQANNAAVHYHFKNKIGLIRAILDHRGDQTEALRCEQLSGLPAGKRLDSRELLRILWFPTMSVTATGGSYSYCRFLLQYMLHPGMVEHPIVGVMTGRADNTDAVPDLPCLAKAIELLRAGFGGVSEATFFRRLPALTLMFLTSVVEYENTRPLDTVDAGGGFDAEPILDMALAALAAPG